MRVVVDREEMLPEFLCYLITGSPLVLAQIAELCKGSTREFINQTILKSIVFPKPPIQEQREITRRVKELFTLADHLEARYEKARAQVDRLTQSVLAKAFRGELVPTEAELARREGRSYETAEQMLARIQANAATAAKGASPRRRKVLEQR